MASMGTLSDPFVSSALNTQLWSSFTGGSATFSFGNGMSVVYPASTTSSTDGDISSVASYDLTGSAAFMNVTSVASGAASTDHGLRLWTGGGDFIGILYEGGSLYFQKFVSSVQTNISNVVFDAKAHAWWRLRESGGTTYWETSSDGFTYTVQAFQSNPITLTSLQVRIAATAFSTSSSPGLFTWRYFNIPVSEGPFNHARVGDGMSRSEVAN